MQCCKLKTLIYLTILLGSLCLNQVDAQEWKLEKQKGQVQIYSQQTESGYKNVLAKTTVKAPAKALVALLDDISAGPDWIHNCLGIKLIEQLSTSEKLMQTFFSAPWPVKNRDMVTLSHTQYLDDKIQITITDKSTHIEPHKKYVRMHSVMGVWQAQVNAQGLTEITYQGGGNPGGNLPTFLANKEVITSFYHTFINLTQIILAAKYQPTEITN
ncbi:START domain-containing protein [Paraglaciecola aestuariivivens]